MEKSGAAATPSRLACLAERRAGPIVIVHRGAWAFAPENSLAAYTAALDYGADGCEVDLRRTCDGELVLFHDDMLDHLTCGFGAVSQLTDAELSALRPQRQFGRALYAGAPTFAALLDLARQRAMLLHLDVKEPGLEDDIARQLDEAEAWEHVVSINTDNATRLRKNSKLKLLAYKGPGLFDRRSDVDPEAVRAQLARPGQMIIVDDPRVAAHVLHRAPYQPVPLPPARPRTMRPQPQPVTDVFSPFAHLAALARRVDAVSVEPLLALLEAAVPQANPLAGDEALQCRRATRIVERAWAAEKAGELGLKSPRIVTALERLVRERSPHPDWHYHGLDGAVAARALGRLGAVEAAPVLIAAFRRADPVFTRTDFRAKMYLLPALGELRCAAAKKFLMEYVAMTEAQARTLGPAQFEDATLALLAQPLEESELITLLRSANLAVRGTAILECLDYPNATRREALQAATPWALELPRRHREVTEQEQFP